MTYYIVGIGGEVYVARPSCTTDLKETNQDGDHPLALCWVERDGSVICFAGDEDFILPSPYDK